MTREQLLEQIVEKQKELITIYSFLLSFDDRDLDRIERVKSELAALTSQMEE